MIFFILNHIRVTKSLLRSTRNFRFFEISGVLYGHCVSKIDLTFALRLFEQLLYILTLLSFIIQRITYLI